MKNCVQDQMSLCNTLKIIAKYLRPLSKNKHSIDDTLIDISWLAKNEDESDDY